MNPKTTTGLDRVEQASSLFSTISALPPHQPGYFTRVYYTRPRTELVMSRFAPPVSPIEKERTRPACGFRRPAGKWDWRDANPDTRDACARINF